jgi:SEC-C motif-containing protein
MTGPWASYPERVSLPASNPCPCGLDQSYGQCCGRFHSAAAFAGTAEALMRSRYTAFAVQDGDYLIRTWHSSTRPTRIGFDPDQRWTGLEVLATSAGGMLHPTGTVEFRARYDRGGVRGNQHEVSRFVREDGRWVYLGELDEPAD